MRRMAFIIAQLLLVACSAVAQMRDTGKVRVIDRLNFSLCNSVGMAHEGLTPLSLDVTVGYRFASRWSVFATFGCSYALYEEGDVRTYRDAGTLGGGVSYALVRGCKNKAFDHDVSLRLSIANSVGGASWKQTVYDGGFVLSLLKGRLTPVVGLGYRRVVSHTAGVDDLNCFYAKIGFKF